jgi:hypothetical protein
MDAIRFEGKHCFRVEPIGQTRSALFLPTAAARRTKPRQGDHTEQASTDPADQRCDYGCGKNGMNRNAHNIWIDGDPQSRGNCGAQESEGVPDGSRP